MSKGHLSTRCPFPSNGRSRRVCDDPRQAPHNGVRQPGRWARLRVCVYLHEEGRVNFRFRNRVPALGS
ncbi:hypothetical protein SALBM311S_09520 [Streptomyces alboniger]